MTLDQAHRAYWIADAKYRIAKRDGDTEAAKAARKEWRSLGKILRSMGVR
jgi:hypothetical protein